MTSDEKLVIGKLVGQASTVGLALGCLYWLATSFIGPLINTQQEYLRMEQIESPKRTTILRKNTEILESILVVTVENAEMLAEKLDVNPRQVKAEVLYYREPISRIESKQLQIEAKIDELIKALKALKAG